MFDFLKKQLIENIEWLETPGQLAWRVPFADHEIKNGAQLWFEIRNVQFAQRTEQALDEWIDRVDPERV